MKKKMKRFDDGGWAGSDVDKGAATRRLQAANSPSQEERDAVRNLKIETEPRIGPVKNYPKGRDFDSGDEDTSPAVSKPEVSSYGSENRRMAQDTFAPRKAPVVTKEQLAASGLSLRDYLNQQAGLTRRGGAASSDSYRMEGANKPAPEENYRTEGANKKPRGNMGGGKYASEASIYTDLRNPANARDIYNAPDRFSAANIRSALGMKKGGAVKMASGGSVSSASRRADGIATKGKTRGKFC